MVVTKEVFLIPGLLPWKADVVIMLSDDWITPTDIRSCFRLRLTSAGPSGDPVTVVRIVAKGTIEELGIYSLTHRLVLLSFNLMRVVAKRGSLLQLQGISLIDLFPGFTQSFPGLPGSSFVMLGKAPSAAILKRYRGSDSLSIFWSALGCRESSSADPTAGTDESFRLLNGNHIDDVHYKSLQWLLVLRIAMQQAEFQFSKVGKYLPLSLLPSSSSREVLASSVR